MNKMISCWGSSGSGKSTVALALAAQLAALNREVLVTGPDGSTPALPVYLPKEQIPSSGSLGDLISLANLTDTALRGHIHLHPDSSHIAFMGLTSGESSITYSKFYSESAWMSLLTLLSDTPFDYIIFDCETNPALHSLTQLALRTADHILRILTPDVAGVEFERAQANGLMRAEMFHYPEQIRIIGPVHRALSPAEEVLALTGQAEYLLPFSPEVYNRKLAGQLVMGCRDRDGVQFDKQMRRLAGRLADQTQ